MSTERGGQSHFAHFGVEAGFLLDTSSDAGVTSPDEEVWRLADSDAELHKVAPFPLERPSNTNFVELRRLGSRELAAELGRSRQRLRGAMNIRNSLLAGRDALLNPLLHYFQPEELT